MIIIRKSILILKIQQAFAGRNDLCYNFLKFIFVSSCRHCNFMASNYQPITMQDFVHLHVHTQYSLLDGQASVSALVDKAMKDGMKGNCRYGPMEHVAIKEFTNYS